MALAQCPGNWRMVTCFSCFHIGIYFVIISICISITVASYSTILIKLFFHIFTSPFIFHLHGQNERSALFLKIHCALVLLCRAFDIDKPYSMRFFVLHICYGEFSYSLSIATQSCFSTFRISKFPFFREKNPIKPSVSSSFPFSFWQASITFTLSPPLPKATPIS